MSKKRILDFFRVSFLFFNICIEKRHFLYMLFVICIEKRHFLYIAIQTGAVILFFYRKKHCIKNTYVEMRLQLFSCNFAFYNV